MMPPRKVIIEIDCTNAAFEEDPLREITFVLLKVPDKIIEQMQRPKSLCGAAEAADKLLDRNGNTTGKLVVELEDDTGEEEELSDCPAIGVGGMHSPEYSYGGECHWCGEAKEEGCSED